MNAKISATQRADSPFKNLIYEMNLKQLSYKGLAKLMDSMQVSISNKIRGKQNFTAEQIAKLVEIFNKPAEYLMKRDD